MKNYTKRGLLFLMISVIISIIATVFIFFVWNSINLESISSENLANLLIAIIPPVIVSAIGGILALVGAIFIYMGKDEFGEKHARYIKYALILVVISILFGIISGVISSFIQYSSTSYTIFGTTDTSQLLENLRVSFAVSSITTVIGAMIGGLIWVFGLYQIENDIGKKILITAYISMIIVAIAVAISSFLFFTEFSNSILAEDLADTQTTSQLLSSMQYLGDTLTISVIGGIIQSSLLFVAIYIPYKRIDSGELTPVLPHNMKICKNCGREAGSEYVICAYCGHRFDSFSDETTSSKTCKNCGYTLQSDYVTCPNCGKKIDEYP